MSDRMIHAAAGEMEIVRYNRAGKWYVEYSSPRMRPSRHVGVNEAARLAVELERDGRGCIYLGVSGGSAFDRKVKALSGSDVGLEPRREPT
jgi:hypothetical protein